MDRKPVIQLKKFSSKPEISDSETKDDEVALAPFAATDTQGNNERILVIEDDDFMRGLLSTKLDKAGYKTTEASTAEKGLEYLTLIKPDLILLDLMLPGMNGFQFLSERNAKGYESTKVIVLSNLGNKDNIDHAMGLGATDYLIKANFSLAAIIERVAFHLHTDK